MYSIDQLLAQPPFSAIFSFLLILGCDLIGKIVFEKFGFFDDESREWIRWQGTIVGAMTLSAALYPLALFQHTSRLFMQEIAIFCMLLGVIHLFKTIEDFIKNTKSLKKYYYLALSQTLATKLLIFMVFGMGLLAIGPVTHADALEYHLGVAIAILNHGGMPVIPEWFLSHLTGNGEVLIAMAMAVGGEQFASLLQYASLLGILSIIIFAKNTTAKTQNKRTNKLLDLILLAALSSPVLLFLVSSSKPQLWPIAMTTLALALVIHPSRRNLPRYKLLLNYSLICLLVMTASQAKFNYILGGGIVGFLAIIFMGKKGYFFTSIGITLIAALLIISPPVIWKVLALNTNWIDALIHPFPGNLPGSDLFISSIQFATDTDSRFFFPLSIAVPSNIGSYGVILGVGWLLFFTIRPGKDLWLVCATIASVIVIIVNIFLAPPNARSYLEPYFWLLIILAMQLNHRLLTKNYNWLKFPILGQTFLTVIALLYGVMYLFPGAISPRWRTTIMEGSANGYEVMQWADKILPRDAILLNGHRSMALSPRDSVSGGGFTWNLYVDTKDEKSSVYLNRIKLKKVSHALIYGPINYDSAISHCYGKIVAGPFQGQIVSRNPFNFYNNGKYEAWIVEFKSEELPNCAK